MSKDRQPNPNFIPPASVRIPEPPAIPPVPLRASEYITISVAEYHFLTKTATLLEAVLSADPYNPKPVVDAVRKTMQEMTGAGAEK